MARLCVGSKAEAEDDNHIVYPILMFTSIGKLQEHKLVLQLEEHQINVQKKRGKCVVKSMGIAELQEVITGQLPKALTGKTSKSKNTVQPECCVSLIANKTDDEVELIAKTRDVAQNLVNLLKRMQKKYKSSVRDKLDDWVYIYFNEADTSKNGSLSLDEICGVVQKLGCNLKREEIKERFNLANTDKNDSLNVEEFRSFFHELLSLSEIDSLFVEYGGDAFLDFSEFKTFISSALHIAAVTGGDVMHRFEETLTSFERSEEARKRNLLTIDGFRLMYINGCPLISAFNELHNAVYQDMNRPINEYWIDSSHNTYLEGRQLLGTSSADAYRHALRLGCRSVELDLWDGKDEPIITHGFTYTTHLPLSQALQAINETAFEKSPYPVILSLENHLSIEFQKMAASMFQRIFGDRLYATKQRPGAKLPSPEQLKFKIILKTKALKDGEPKRKSKPAEENNQTASNLERSESKKKKEKEETDEIARELSDLIVLCKSVGFRGCDQAFTSQQPDEMSSLSETKANKLVEADSRNFIRYTNSFLVRIYPKGSRVDSCNYNPLPLWNVGCQLVASNVQRRDEPFALGRALFADNGGCGYVLKPPLLRDSVPDTPIELTVRVISGFQLPRFSDHLDPVVTVVVAGVKADEARQSTPVVKRNSFHPVWHATFKFPITTPSLAFIRFLVHDDDDNEKRMCAQNSFRVINLANGFRALPLLDAELKLDDKAFLFVDIWSRPASAIN